jgi:lysophospholipase L1-like esterase
VQYAVTVSNSATAAHSVLLTATVPANTTVARSELSLAAYCDGVGGFTTCAAGQTLQFVGFNVGVGASVTVVYPALISTTTPPSNGTLLNSNVWVEDTSLGNEYQVNVAAIASSTALAAVPLTASAVPAPVSVSAGGTVSLAKPNAAGRQQSNVRRPASSSGPKAASTQSQTNIQAPGAANVRASTDTRIVVVLDHALIDGRNWTPNADDRWVNYFAQRLLTERKVSLRMVVAQGVKGISSMEELDVSGTLARLKSGVLTQRAMRSVVFLDGIGDFQLLQLRDPELTGSQIIAIHRHIIERVHALGLKIFGATIIPFEGSTLPANTALGEANRLAVNEWIRNSGAYDAVVDFDLATSDPKHSARLSPAYDSGDHMHPNDVGYQAMAEAIDLSLFDE